MDLSNQTILITGANRGIGLSLVKKLHSFGCAHIHAVVRSQAAADAVAALGSNISTHIADITDVQAVKALADATPDTTLVINNAGTLDFGSFFEADAAAVNHNMQVNYFGTLNMVQAFAPVLRANGGGTIANVLTLVALASMPSLSVYNASKAAAWSMTQSVRASLKTDNISVVGIFPGAVDTDMLKSVDMPKTDPDEIADAVISGLQNNFEDIFPDAMSQSLYAEWRKDHKAVEAQFATM